MPRTGRETVNKKSLLEDLENANNNAERDDAVFDAVRYLLGWREDTEQTVDEKAGIVETKIETTNPVFKAEDKK